MLWIVLIGFVAAVIGLFALAVYFILMVALAIAGSVYFVCFLICLNFFPGDLLSVALLMAAAAGTLVNYGLYRAFVAEKVERQKDAP